MIPDEVRAELADALRDDVRRLRPFLGPGFDGWGIALNRGIAETGRGLIAARRRCVRIEPTSPRARTSYVIGTSPPTFIAATDAG